MNKTIKIAALAIRNESNEILHVRKRGTDAFIMVGGKIEPGESGQDAALREVCEEIDVYFDPAEIVSLGVFTAPAANEPDFIVECDVFVTANHVLLPAVSVQREIEEARWFSLDSEGSDLAPLSRDVVHPVITEWLNVSS